MAQRRMFSLQVIDTDQFLDMPASTQALYFHLGMRADDDGFVSSPRKIMKITNSSDDDYKLLLAKRFVIPFESGVCVIRHWRIHNYIQSDRYHETIYRDEKQSLTLENDHYEALDTGCIHDASRVDTEVRLGKVRIGEVKKEKAPVPKTAYAENVKLTEAEYDWFVSKYGEAQTRKLIEVLDAYKLSKGKTYKSDAGAIRSWVIDKVKPKAQERSVAVCKVCATEPVAAWGDTCPKCK